MQSCEPGREKQQTEIKSVVAGIEKQFQKGIIDSTSIHKAIESMNHFAGSFPQDSMSAVYLFQAAGLQQTLGEFRGAIASLERLRKDFPQSRQSAPSLFTEGFIYDSKLFRIDSAAMVYKKFLREFPQHELIPSVRTALSNLGKSPDQIYMELMKKKEKDSTAKSN